LREREGPGGALPASVGPFPGLNRGDDVRRLRALAGGPEAPCAVSGPDDGGPDGGGPGPGRGRGGGAPRWAGGGWTRRGPGGRGGRARRRTGRRWAGAGVREGWGGAALAWVRVDAVWAGGPRMTAAAAHRAVQGARRAPARAVLRS